VTTPSGVVYEGTELEDEATKICGLTVSHDGA
jgi:hypothetical protein